MSETKITNDNADVVQYLTFQLDQEVFALEVSTVREVLDLIKITRMPGAPDFMRGVIDVRGDVVPVMDLRLKFGLTRVENTQHTRIIVMEPTVEGEMFVIGVLADAVNEVVALHQDQIEARPKIGTKWRTEFIKGIGKHNDRFIIIIDANRVFTTDELAIADKIVEKPAQEKP